MMRMKLLSAVAIAAAALVAAPASAQVVGYDTAGSSFACNGTAGCLGGGSAVTIGGLTLTFGAASGLVTAPSNITLGTITTGGAGNATLDGITLDLVVNSLPGGAGSLPGGNIMGVLTGTSSNASITWSSGGVQLGNFIYTVTNSPLSLVPPTASGPAGPGTTSIQGFVASVPEPATWAMMLMGFGAIGFAMRRRRSTAFAQVA